jgi:hypothetical protein
MRSNLPQRQDWNYSLQRILTKRKKLMKKNPKPVGIDTEEIYITRKEYEELLVDHVTLETIFKGIDRLIYGSVNNAKAFRKQLKEEKEQDLSTCPNCGGPADNGFNRYVPPSPYWCTKCEAIATRNMKNDENE